MDLYINHWRISIPKSIKKLNKRNFVPGHKKYILKIFIQISLYCKIKLGLNSWYSQLNNWNSVRKPEEYPSLLILNSSFPPPKWKTCSSPRNLEKKLHLVGRDFVRRKASEWTRNQGTRWMGRWKWKRELKGVWYACAYLKPKGRKSEKGIH